MCLTSLGFAVFCGMYNSLYTRLASSSHESFKQSRQIQVQNNVVRRLHAIFRSKVAGSPGGGVTWEAYRTSAVELPSSM